MKYDVATPAVVGEAGGIRDFRKIAGERSDDGGGELGDVDAKSRIDGCDAVGW